MSRWTPTLAIQRTGRRVEDAKDALMDIAGIWGDVEQGVIDDADRIILDLENMLATLKETLKEKAEAGEHIGL
jgi:hypothetical protein